MEIKIDKTLQPAIEEQAKMEGITPEELVNHILAFSLDTALCTISAKRIEALLIEEILPRLINVQTNTLAARHQILNLHADIAKDRNRAVVIAKDATEAATSSLEESYGDID